MSSFESELIRWLNERLPRHTSVPVGIGDDMAAVRSTGEVMWITSDMLLDGVHFDSNRVSFESIGRKAMACGLSDCAAMAVRPLAATVSVAWPRNGSLDSAKAVYEGMIAVANEYDVAVAGGDTTIWSSPCAIDVTVLAEPYPSITPVRRGGAKAGDRLYVTGPLGGSIRQKHLHFTPRVREARVLAESFGPRLHAMMDVTDGLSLDLWRMCQASGVGAELSESHLERAISDDARAIAREDGRSALEHALSDGEDFELLLAVDPSIEATPEFLIEVGRITREGFAIKCLDGRVEPAEPRGYWH